MGMFFFFMWVNIDSEFFQWQKFANNDSYLKRKSNRAALKQQMNIELKLLAINLEASLEV